MCFRVIGEKKLKIKFSVDVPSWERKASTLIQDKVILDVENGKKLLERKGDFVVYEVFNLWKSVKEYKEVKEKYGLNCDITLLRHGVFSLSKNGELFETYGHIHQKARGELYTVLKNECFLMLMHKKSYTTYLVKLKAGDGVFIPPDYFHRLISTTKDCAVLNFVPEDAGHDYQKINGKGFAYHLFLTNGWYEVVKNPAYAKSKFSILKPKSVSWQKLPEEKLKKILFHPKANRKFYIV